VTASREAILSHLNAHATLDASACKDLLNTTRKYAIPILEYWDKQGLTKRIGNERVLRENRETAS
jgi:selenocysteine-specific elongation factor